MFQKRGVYLGQAWGVYNSYSTGGQGFMAVSKSSVYALVLSLFTAINLWHCAITIIYTPRLPQIYTPFFGTFLYFVQLYELLW